MNTPRAILCIEFTDAEVNRELGVEQCMRTLLVSAQRGWGGPRALSDRGTIPHAIASIHYQDHHPSCHEGPMRYWFLLTVVSAVLLFSYQANGGNTLAKAANLEKLNTEPPTRKIRARRPTATGLLYARKGRQFYDIYHSKRTASTAAFRAGKPLSPTRAADVRAPVLATRRNTTSPPTKCPTKSQAEEFRSLMQIGFQAPLSSLGDVNTKADEMYPWITPGGKEFYLAVRPRTAGSCSSPTGRRLARSANRSWSVSRPAFIARQSPAMG